MIPCPWCGHRNVDEFRYVGEAGHRRPDPNTTSRLEWRSYLYFRNNACGWVAEDWYHRAGCRRYFSTDRNTVTNETGPRALARERADANESDEIGLVREHGQPMGGSA